MALNLLIPPLGENVRGTDDGLKDIHLDAAVYLQRELVNIDWRHLDEDLRSQARSTRSLEGGG